jgi:ketosteroid isomerase-like protein
MGMKSGKTLKPARAAMKRKVKVKRKTRPAAGAKRVAKPAAKARPVAKAKPIAVPKPVVKVQTRTVEVDRNAKLRELAQRIVDVTVSNNDEGSLALYSDAVESKEAGNPPSFGVEAIRQKFVMWRGMVSDAAFLPRSVLADGNTIVIEWDGKVTLAASGRVVDFPETAVHEIENGKIVRERFYYDPSLLAP